MIRARGRLAELGEDQDAGPRQTAAQFERRLQAVVLRPGRHPDVDDGDVRRYGHGAAEELRGVAGAGDHVEAGVGKDPADALPQQDVVLAEGDAQGIIRLGTAHRALMEPSVSSEVR